MNNGNPTFLAKRDWNRLTPLKSFNDLFTGNFGEIKDEVSYDQFSEYELNKFYSNKHLDCPFWFYHVTALNTNEAVVVGAFLRKNLLATEIAKASKDSGFYTANIIITSNGSHHITKATQLVLEGQTTLCDSIELLPKKPTHTDHIYRSSFFPCNFSGKPLVKDYAKFYSMLSNYSMFLTPPVALRLYFHPVVSSIIRRDLLKICNDFIKEKKVDTGAEQVKLFDTLRCLYMLVENADYAWYPQLPEIVDHELVQFILYTSEKAEQLFDVVNGQMPVPNRPLIPAFSILDSKFENVQYVTFREKFKWMRLTPVDVETIFFSMTTVSSSGLFFKYIMKKRNKEGAGYVFDSRSSIMKFYYNKVDSATTVYREWFPATVRRMVFRNIEDIIPLLNPVGFDNTDNTVGEIVCKNIHGCWIVAVNIIVRTWYIPLIRSFVSKYQSKDSELTDKQWAVFTLTGDFIENLELCYRMWQPHVRVTADVMKSVIGHVLQIIETNSERKKKDVDANKLSEKITNNNTDVMNQVAADIINIMDKNMSQHKILRIMLAVFGFKEAKKYLSIINIESAINNEDKNKFCEPIVMFDNADKVTILLDPDFYPFYFVVRILANIHAENDVKALLMPHLSDIFKFSFYDIHQKYTFVSLSALKKSAELALQEKMPLPIQNLHNQLPSTQVNSIDGESVNIMRTVPAFEKEHRALLFTRTVEQLFLRMGGKFINDSKIDPLFNMSEAIGFMTGNIFRIPDGLHSLYMATSARLSAWLDLEIDAEGARLYDQVRIRTRHMGTKSPPDRIVVPIGDGSNKYTLTCQVSLSSPVRSFDTNIIMHGFWLFSPSRDTLERVFVFKDMFDMKINKEGYMGEPSLDVPVRDGFEGVYSLVVGSELYGYCRYSFNLVFTKLCVRTGKIYEEAKNKWGSAQWKYENKHLYGWHSDKTASPYATYYSDRSSVLLGDVLLQHQKIPPLIILDKHADDQLLTFLFTQLYYFATGLNTPSPPEPIRYVRDFVNTVDSSKKALLLSVAGQSLTQWFHVITNPITDESMIDFVNTQEGLFSGQRVSVVFNLFEKYVIRQLEKIYGDQIHGINRKLEVNESSLPSPHSTQSTLTSEASLKSDIPDDIQNGIDNTLEEVAKIVKQIDEDEIAKAMIQNDNDWMPSPEVQKETVSESSTKNTPKSVSWKDVTDFINSKSPHIAEIPTYDELTEIITILEELITAASASEGKSEETTEVLIKKFKTEVIKKQAVLIG